jgi:hypothetical protein
MRSAPTRVAGRLIHEIVIDHILPRLFVVLVRVAAGTAWPSLPAHAGLDEPAGANCVGEEEARTQPCVTQRPPGSDPAEPGGRR